MSLRRPFYTPEFVPPEVTRNFRRGKNHFRSAAFFAAITGVSMYESTQGWNSPDLSEQIPAKAAALVTVFGYIATFGSLAIARDYMSEGWRLNNQLYLPEDQRETNSDWFFNHFSDAP